MAVQGSEGGCAESWEAKWQPPSVTRATGAQERKDRNMATSRSVWRLERRLGMPLIGCFRQDLEDPSFRKYRDLRCVPDNGHFARCVGQIARGDPPRKRCPS